MTLTELLLPEGGGMQVDGVVVEANRPVLSLSSTNSQATCPYCGTESSRINNHYQRKPADVPCAGSAVQLRIKVPCFFCMRPVTTVHLPRDFTRPPPALASQRSRRKIARNDACPARQPACDRNELT